MNQLNIQAGVDYIIRDIGFNHDKVKITIEFGPYDKSTVTKLVYKQSRDFNDDLSGELITHEQRNKINKLP